MYSACRSRLATERHLRPCNRDIIFAVPLCQNVKEHHRAAVRNTPPYYRVFALLREKGESNPPLILLLLARCSVYGSFSPRCPYSGAMHVFPCCQRDLLKGCGRPLVILGFSGCACAESNGALSEALNLSRIRGETPCAASVICANIRTGIAP